MLILLAVFYKFRERLAYVRKNSDIHLVKYNSNRNHSYNIQQEADLTVYDMGTGRGVEVRLAL